MFRPTVTSMLLCLTLTATIVAQAEEQSSDARRGGDARAAKEGGDAARSPSKPGGVSKPGAPGFGASKLTEKGQAELSEEEEKVAAEALLRMTPAERLARSPSHGSLGHCRFDTHLLPERLLPGRSGTLIVTMVFEGDSVMPSPPNLICRAVGGPPDLLFGDYQLEPAPLGGKQAKSYAGVPVYDNWATLRIPVTLAAQVALGQERQGCLEMTFDLYNAVSGQPVGRFIENVQVKVEAGSSPDPAILMATVPSEALKAAPAGAVPTEKEQAQQVAAPSLQSPSKADGRAGNAQSLPSGGIADPEDAESASFGMPVVLANELNVWLPVSGGLLVIAVVGLIMLRRR
ncbi:hypothetical protein LBMAG49_08030 [Planctomycetota bacterium]|nr:hypothetical protein LBMAG49_08030 [Planctomycetota bacterium]